LAKVKIIGLEQVSRSVSAKARSLIYKELKDEKYSKLVSLEYRNFIREKNASPSGRKFPNVGEQWRKRRERLATKNKLFTKAPSPSGITSNLTFTGRLLNAIEATFKRNRNKASFFVFPSKEVHPGYKQIKSGRSRRVPYATIFDGQEKQGREVLTDPSPELKKRIDIKLIKLLKRALN